MRQYQRYIGMHLVLPAILITASLTGIIWLTQVLRFVDFMLNRGLSMADFLYLTGLMLPSLLLILIPVALTIAVMYTYQKLTTESELIVFHAVGLSRMQLALPAIAVGVVCSILCYTLSLYIMPLSNQKFRDVRTFFRDQYASVLLEEEVFNTPIDGVTVYVRARDRENNLYGILLHDNRTEGIQVTMMAESGKLEQTSSGPRFLLKKGLRQEVKYGKLSWLSFEDYTLDIAFYGQVVQRNREPDERTIGELFHTQNLTPQEQVALRAEAHQRLTWPLFATALPMLMLALMLSTEFNRRGQWKRLVKAGVAATAVTLLFFALRNLVVQHTWMIPLLYLLLFSTMGVSLWLLMRNGNFVLRLPALLLPERRPS